MNEPKETAIPKSNRDDRHIEISGIDFQLLRWQKRRMLILRHDHSGCEGSEEYIALSGIIHLIDGIQDAAVDSGEYTEQEVFGDLGREKS